MEDTYTQVYSKANPMAADYGNLPEWDIHLTRWSLIILHLLILLSARTKSRSSQETLLQLPINSNKALQEIWDNVEDAYARISYEPHAERTLKKQAQSTSHVIPQNVLWSMAKSDEIEAS
ncbi:hypothetical protein Tco_0293953 [Tanacetum coccineum]